MFRRDCCRSTGHKRQCQVLLRLYNFVVTNLSSKENLSIVQVSAVQGSLSWISKLKKLLIAKEGPKQIYCVTELQREYPSGLLGMINCLRLEGCEAQLRCIQLNDVRWEEFLDDHSHFWDHIKGADMTMNVVKDGEVGSYAHTHTSPLDTSRLKRSLQFGFKTYY